MVSNRTSILRRSDAGRKSKRRVADGGAQIGSNRRYADHVDRAGAEREAARAMAAHTPETLHAVELDLEHEPLTRPPAPIPVEAWVRYGTSAVNVRGLATAWTRNAVAVKWPAPDGTEHKAWVWASAVRRTRHA